MRRIVDPLWIWGWVGLVVTVATTGCSLYVAHVITIEQAIVGSASVIAFLTATPFLPGWTRATTRRLRGRRPRPTLAEALRRHGIRPKPFVWEEMRREGLVEKVAVGSCVELTGKHGGWGPGELLVEEEKPRPLNEQVRAAVARHPAQYAGRTKFALQSSVAELTDRKPMLKLAMLPGATVVASHENFETIRANLADGCVLFDLARSQIPNFFVLHIVMLTSDGFLLVAQRSDDVYYYRRHWSISAEEQMDEKKDRDANGKPDPFATVVRGIGEEIIGKDRELLNGAAIRIHSVFRELDYVFSPEKGRAVHVLNTGAVAIVTLPIEMSDLWRNWDEAIDKAEFMSLVALRATYENLFGLLNSTQFKPWEFAGDISVPSRHGIEHLQKQSNERQWHPSSRLRILTLLRERFMDRLRADLGVA